MINIEYIRSSSYSCCNLCEMQYYLSYVLGIPQTTHPKAELGTIVHKVMECLALLQKNRQNSLPLSIVDDSLGKIETSNEAFESDDFVNNLVNLSFKHYSGQSLNQFDDSHLKQCVLWSHKAIHGMNGALDPRKLNIVDAEKYFDIEIREPWAKTSTGYLHLKGTIDLIVQTENGTIESIDWKTGKRINWATGVEKTYSHLTKDPQLRIYHYALTNLYGLDKNYMSSIYYINDGGVFTIPFHRSEIIETLKMIRGFYEYVKNITRPKMKNDWFCNRVCFYGKNAHPIHIDETICQFIANKLKVIPIQQVTKEETFSGYSISNYSNPGE